MGEKKSFQKLCNCRGMSSSEDELRFDRASVAASRDFRLSQRNRRYDLERFNFMIHMTGLLYDSYDFVFLMFRMKNRIVLANDQGFQRLWGNGSKKVQAPVTKSPSMKSQQAVGNEDKTSNEHGSSNSQSVEKAQNSLPNESNGGSHTHTSSVQFAEETRQALVACSSDTAGSGTRGNPKDGNLDGCNSTLLSIAPTHDDLRGLSPTDIHAAHHNTYNSSDPYSLESPAFTTLPIFYTEWRQALLELSTASTALDEARQDFSRFNHCRQKRILNALQITREERHALAKVTSLLPTRGLHRK
jgi:hypothetical protein